MPEVTKQPEALSNIDVGTTYQLQNTSGKAASRPAHVIFIQAATSAPDFADRDRNVLGDREWMEIQIETGESLYAWSAYGGWITVRESI